MRQGEAVQRQEQGPSRALDTERMASELVAIRRREGG